MPLNRTDEHEKPDKQEALNAFLVAAEALDRQGKAVEAEIRYNEALSLCEREFGENSDQTIMTLSILSAFYRSKGRHEDAVRVDTRIGTWDANMAAKAQARNNLSSLGAALSQQKTKNTAGPASNNSPKMLPQNIRRACQILGLQTDTELTVDSVSRAWKIQMLQKNAHPDLGGNAEEALLLNKAKTEILDYLDFITPKKSSLNIGKPK